jgi:hypothetical protein
MTDFPTSAQEWMKSWHAASSAHPKLKTDESHHAQANPLLIFNSHPEPAASNNFVSKR